MVLFSHEFFNNYPIKGIKNFDHQLKTVLEFKNKKNQLRNNKDNNNNYDDIEEDMDNEFGSEIQELFNLNKKNLKKDKDNRFQEPIGITVYYPIGNPPKIIKSIEEENKKNDRQKYSPKNKKSKNFELIFNDGFNFTNVGGYDLIKKELLQSADILVNYTKYEKYNVRIPKGLILEGPPGNGKTIITKAFSGEINIGFIPVSGSQFQEMYVGVGASRVRELFEFAKENKPCIIFIDEIDALGRKRSTDTESSSSERDSTLNELLVGLDGFKNINGVFIIGATNRIDLLDSALIRPGRIDKKIYVGNPDKNTRKEIINIHINGKPHDKNINIDKLVEITNGFSGAEIENLLNEAMLLALRENREFFTKNDIEIIANRILTGWQINENKLSQEMITQIAIHEIGHALVSIFSNYKKIIKVTINLWSPKALGFTLFDTPTDSIISTKENLIKEIMVLLGGRVAEEIFYGEKISSGAVDDFHRVKNIIQKMVLDYGMGTSLFLPYNSDKYREKIDNEIEHIFTEAYNETKYLLTNSKQLIKDCASLLVTENEINEEQIREKINGIYDYLIKK
jgi:cell division protease FtsH